MSQKVLYLIIYMLILGGMCGCERLEIPYTPDKSDEQPEESITPLPDTEQNEEERDGSHENPFTVSDIQTLGKIYDIEDAWVKGYIVGWISGSSYPTGARFTSNSAGNTNLLLADSIFETDPVHCIPIQLPNNSLVRKELNLSDHPQNWKRHIKLKGDIKDYFKVTGMKNTSTYEWLGTSAVEDEKNAFSTTEIDENFDAKSLGDSLKLSNWTILSYSTSYWKIGGDTFERFATICHTDTFANRTFEYWLITPPINLSRLNNAKFSFRTSYNNWDNKSRLEIFIIEGNNPYNNGLLPQLICSIAHPNIIEPNQWLYSEDIELDSYSGIKYIGFRYKGISTGKQGTSFCIDDILLQEKEE